MEWGDLEYGDGWGEDTDSYEYEVPVPVDDSGPEGPDSIYPDYVADSPDQTDWAAGADIVYGAVPGIGLDTDKIEQLAGGNPAYQSDLAAYRAASAAVDTGGGDAGRIGVEISPDGQGRLVDKDTGQTISPTSNPSLWNQAKAMLGPLATLANSPLGKAALAAGLGIGGAALANAITGGSPTFRVPQAATPPAFGSTPAYQPTIAGANPKFQVPTAQGGPAYQVPTAQGGPAFQTPTVGAVPTPPTLSALSALPQAPGTTFASAGSAGSASAPTATGQLKMNTLAQGAVTQALQQGGAEDLRRATAGALEGQGNVGETLAAQSQIALRDIRDTEGAARRVRMDAYGNLIDAMGNPVPLEDAIQAGLADEIMAVLGGQYSNPQLEAQMAEDEATFQQKMLNQLGPGWEVSTAGMQARRNQDIKQAAVREDDKKRTVANYASIEQGRRQFNVTNPQAYQAQSLAQYAGLTGQGLTNPAVGDLAKNLATIAPVGGLVNQQGADAAAGRQDQANLSIALGNLNAATAAGQMQTNVSISNAQMANNAAQAAFNAAVQQGARQDQATIAADQAYYGALVASGARQDQFNLQGAQNDWASGQTLANTQNQFNAQGAQSDWAGGQTLANTQNQFNYGGSQAQFGADVGQVNTQNQMNQTANNANWNAAQHALDQDFAAKMAGTNFTNQASLAGAGATFGSQVDQAKGTAAGIGKTIGTIGGALFGLPTASTPKYTIAQAA